MFPEIGAAAEKLEPGAAAAAAAAFEASSWGVRPAAAPAPAPERKLEEEMLAAAASAPVALAGDAADGGKLAAGSDKDDGSQVADASTVAEPSGVRCDLRVVRPSAALEARPRSAVRRALERAGLGTPQLLPALHMAVLVGVAGTLVVCRAAYVGLGERSDWVAFTGACAGGMQRLAGHCCSQQLHLCSMLSMHACVGSSMSRSPLAPCPPPACPQWWRRLRSRMAASCTAVPTACWARWPPRPTPASSSGCAWLLRGAAMLTPPPSELAWGGVGGGQGQFV